MLFSNSSQQKYFFRYRSVKLHAQVIMPKIGENVKLFGPSEHGVRQSASVLAIVLIKFPTPALKHNTNH